jgi:hypothetical protein
MRYLATATPLAHALNSTQSRTEQLKGDMGLKIVTLLADKEKPPSSYH